MWWSWDLFGGKLCISPKIVAYSSHIALNWGLVTTSLSSGESFLVAHINHPAFCSLIHGSIHGLAGTSSMALDWTPVTHVLPSFVMITFWSLKLSHLSVISTSVCNQFTPNTIWHPPIGRMWKSVTIFTPWHLILTALQRPSLCNLSPPSIIILKACSGVTRSPVLCTTLESTKLWVGNECQAGHWQVFFVHMALQPDGSGWSAILHSMRGEIWLFILRPSLGL